MDTRFAFVFRFTVAVAFGLLFETHVAAQSYCGDAGLNREVDRAAHDQLSLDQLIDLTKRLDSGTSASFTCPPVVAHCLGEKLALGYLDDAGAKLPPQGSDIEGARNELEQARKHGAPWQLLVTLGDIKATLAREHHRPDEYRGAAMELQMALNVINEPPKCSAFGEVTAPNEDIMRIRKRAAEAVLLSSQMDIARTKSGDCGGIFLSKVRGIEVESVPLPITFAYNRADLTDEGRKAADALLACVKEKQITDMVLSGHTDLHGSDAYNIDLSARRLRTVEAFLRVGGYRGDLHLIAKGKREPFQPDDPTQHSADELDQMNRRVELRKTEK